MEYRNNDVMHAFFTGKIGKEFLNRPQSKKVELGHGSGLGHKDGSYSQYLEKLSKQSDKGNGIIYMGKDVNVDKNMYAILNPIDKFSLGDIPKVLILYYNIMKDIRLRTVWKDSIDETILEQYYDIPSAHSLGYDWWDEYGVFFIGPEELGEGEYSVEITSYQLFSHSPGYGNKFNTTTASIKYSVIDTEDLEEESQEEESQEKESQENLEESEKNPSNEQNLSNENKEKLSENLKQQSTLKKDKKNKEEQINKNDNEEIDVKVFGMK